MLRLTTKDLEREGICFEGTSQFVLLNTLFTKGQSFAQADRDMAIQTCQKYLKENIVCLMVETSEQITLWREQKHRNSNFSETASASIPAKTYQNRVNRSPMEGLEKNRNKKLLNF